LVDSSCAFDLAQFARTFFDPYLLKQPQSKEANGPAHRKHFAEEDA
jgi:hypothetical protein